MGGKYSSSTNKRAERKTLMKKLLMMGGFLASAFVLTGKPALAQPDDYWATSRGYFYEEGAVKLRTFWSRNCDFTLAERNALSQCEKAGGESCQIIEVRQRQCGTKCNCS